MSQRNGNIVPAKNQSPKQRIDGTATLLDCYVGLYEHYNDFRGQSDEAERQKIEILAVQSVINENGYAVETLELICPPVGAYF